MPLSPGARLGPYEILARLGAGGMGEVYRARDTRLDRIVAIKILPGALATDPQFLERFDREARAISQLTHPHICALYDVGADLGTAFLVMEYLEGETLADRLRKGALPLDEMLKMAAQIADALSAAHRRGIVHRDLKPGNLMLTKSGVKLLDFGLAKTGASVVAGAAPSMLATTPPALTAQGALLGTFQYMAPEQLDGHPADVRSDIFALGAVIYEMATAKRAFMAPLVRLIPNALDRVVRGCLETDPDERWQSAHDVRRQLDAILPVADDTPKSAETLEGGRHRRTAWRPWALAVAGIAVAVAAARLLPTRPVSSVGPVVRFSLAPPVGGGFYQSAENTGLAVSPDGSQIAFSASDASGVNRIWLRPVAALEATAVAGTNGATSLFWSPDGQSLAFFTSGKLRRIDVRGGAPVSICDVREGVGFSGTWGADGQILFSSIEGEALFRVSVNGNVPAEVMKPDGARNEVRLNWPLFLPDGHRFLYLLRRRDDTGHLMIAALDTPSREVMPLQSSVQYVDPGYLVFASEGGLLGQRFDVSRGEIIGAPFSIAAVVSFSLMTTVARFAASPSGTLVYQSKFNEQSLMWFDRAGREAGSIGERGEYQHLRLSPDARQVVFSRARAGAGDVWQIDLERRSETRLTFGPGSKGAGPFAPDGRTLFFSAIAGAPPAILRKDLTTGVETAVLPATSTFQEPEDVSPDGRTLLYTKRAAGGNDIWMVALDGAQPAAVAVNTPFEESGVRFSRDGRYFSFTSTLSGGPEIYLSPFPPTGEKIRVSTAGGGILARWSRDGRELLYESADNHLMAVPIATSPSLRLGTPALLFELAGRRPWYGFDVAPDGRVLAIVQQSRARDQPLAVVLNWRAGLAQ